MSESEKIVSEAVNKQQGRGFYIKLNRFPFEDLVLAHYSNKERQELYKYIWTERVFKLILALFVLDEYKKKMNDKEDYDKINKVFNTIIKSNILRRCIFELKPTIEFYVSIICDGFFEKFAEVLSASITTSDFLDYLNEPLNLHYVEIEKILLPFVDRFDELLNSV